MNSYDGPPLSPITGSLGRWVAASLDLTASGSMEVVRCRHHVTHAILHLAKVDQPPIFKRYVGNIDACKLCEKQSAPEF